MITHSTSALTFDPVTLEVIQNGLESLVDEMALTVMRTAHSGIVKDAMDYSTAFCDREGRVISQGLTIVLHLGSFPDAVAAVRDIYEGDIAEGDVFILNDPYGSGGIHLPDIYVIKPIFAVGALQGFCGVVAHHADVGGIVPGSNSTDSKDIYQEGIRIPALKLFERGKPNHTLFSIIEKNVRIPGEVLGDLRAQLAAAGIGERAYINLVERYGALAMHRYTDEILDYSERIARQEISALPDGNYEFSDHVDADNIVEGPVLIKVAVEITGDQMTVDFEGTSEQVPAGINSPLPFSKAAVFGAVRLLFRQEIPNAVGFHRPIEVLAPLGTVLNPVSPAPCGARGITGFRAMDAVLGALAQAAPDRVPADGDGGNSLISIGGYDGEGNPFSYVDLFCGARGGMPSGDGPEGVPHPGANIASTPVEIAELEEPVRIEEYEMVQNSGGAGQFRGALAQVRSVRCLADQATLQVRSDKRYHPPYGLHGGRPGTPSTNILRSGRGEKLLKTLANCPISRGDLFVHTLAGGGGWGDPLDRSPDDVLRDVREEKMSIDYARREYGVAFDANGHSVDASVTTQLRTEMRLRASRAEGAQ